MVNANRSFEVSKDGIFLDEGVHISAGASAPVHSAPIGSPYYQTNGTWHIQAGPGEDDWVEFSQGASRDCDSIFVDYDGCVLVDYEFNVICEGS